MQSINCYFCSKYMWIKRYMFNNNLSRLLRIVFVILFLLHTANITNARPIEDSKSGIKKEQSVSKNQKRRKVTRKKVTTEKKNTRKSNMPIPKPLGPSVRNTGEFWREFDKAFKNMADSFAIRFEGGYNLKNGSYHKYYFYDKLSSVTYNYPQDTLIKDKVFYIKYKPGARILKAIEKKDLTSLTSRELQTYQYARGIVKQARDFAQGDTLRLELFLHDWLTVEVDYYTETPQPEEAEFKSAIGAICNKKANCAGYTDAFYLLGRMAGLDIESVVGFAKEPHAWNVIKLGEKWYGVDVTWDNIMFKRDDIEYTGYVYLNAPYDIMIMEHEWEEGVNAKQLVEEKDDKYMYMWKDRVFGGYSRDNAMEVLNIGADQLGMGVKDKVYLMSNVDSTMLSASAVSEYVSERLAKWGKYGRVFVSKNTQGKYSWYFVQYEPKEDKKRK